ncbi:MAG: metallophosphoesterase [Acidobacteria bacterium]|nr:MAG: metallophosphoesterase [Acidobacteriota bacterium]
MRIGVLSDTHDLLRPEALDALAGADLIVHLGDVCSPGILQELSRLAPVRAVRGNCDGGAWAASLPPSDTFEAEGITIHARHDLGLLDIAPDRAGIAVVLHGHSHTPERRRRGGVLYLNPGSAGPRRFRYPVTLAILEIEGGTPRPRFVRLAG